MRRAARFALTVALVLAVPAREAEGFMRPSVRASAPRADGKFVCRSPGGIWDVQLETNAAGVVVGKFVARDSGGDLQAVGVVRDGRLMLAIEPEEDGGIVVYRFAGADARGEYTTWRAREMLGEELLGDGPSAGPPGSYKWIARLPSATPLPLGSGGQGTLTIAEAGEIYRLDWHNGVTGVGLRHGADLAVAWSGRTHEIVLLAPAPDGWRGVIASDGTDKPFEFALVR
jgi:hypothetical protein